jgi:D-serine deaminase-like pyridoxal phosphate-dependent protein
MILQILEGAVVFQLYGILLARHGHHSDLSRHFVFVLSEFTKISLLFLVKKFPSIHRDIFHSQRRMMMNIPLATPAFLVYEQVVRDNSRRMQERAKQFHLRLRPHVKTHKTREGVIIQTSDQKSSAEERRIVVSTLAEAEFLFPIANDILYAVPIFSFDKLHRVVQLMNRGCKMHIEMDCLEGLKFVKEYGKESGFSGVFSVFVNLNCGGNREGCDPSATESFELVKQIVEYEHTVFAGIYTHGGHSYGLTDPQQRQQVAEMEAATVHNFAKRLIDEYSIKAPVVSIGSTPTCSLLLSWEHLRNKYFLVDEIHPGNYIFYDYMMYQMGNCHQSDIAVTVLTTVIGKNRDKKTLLIDAGALALSKDLGVKDLKTGEFAYGVVKGEANMKIKSLTQEMGLIQCPDMQTLDKFNLGDKLEIYPNHSCLTAALFPEYQIVNKEGQIIGTWIPCRGW